MKLKTLYKSGAANGTDSRYLKEAREAAF